jgi:hypothetical protein
VRPLLCKPQGGPMAAPVPVAVPAIQATLIVARTGIQLAAAAQGAPALLVAAGVGATFLLVGWGASRLLSDPRR